MRSITTPRLTAALLAVALSIPVAAWAQTTTPTTNGATTLRVRENVEQRIADMHATLHITSAQEAQWDQFAQVMLDNAQSMRAELTKNAANPATQTADQAMQNYAEIAQVHAQNVQKLATAFNTLYASLQPDQKQAADQMFRARASERDQKKQGG
jgi:periplasmic protein CpxP/Spy